MVNGCALYVLSLVLPGKKPFGEKQNCERLGPKQTISYWARSGCNRMVLEGKLKVCKMTLGPKGGGCKVPSVVGMQLFVPLCGCSSAGRLHTIISSCHFA